eukprot:398804_1
MEDEENYLAISGYIRHLYVRLEIPNDLLVIISRFLTLWNLDDEWDIANDSSTVISGNIIENKLIGKIEPAVFGKKIVSNGRHKWTFKIGSKIRSFHSFIGIVSVSDVINESNKDQSTFISIYNSFVAKKCRILQLMNGKIYDRRNVVWKGYFGAIKSGYLIDIYLRLNVANTKQNKLYFHVNNELYGVAMCHIP